ncbi:hypothetical protein [Paraburkholderia sartisoli]|uniref:Uncharacterized protein n=1 Tax=Paraburkholderia sartisoli TaxID=83784 RepID=A0A1H4CGH5_9BURK|nr:hypothetical protein [Paraburkholderia sartisoli]SEA59511.1 hypothetical protein SAMN05192564_102301 [Paraburkholderia sartisoli]
MKTIIVMAYLSMFSRQSCRAAMLLGFLTASVAAQEPTSTSNTPSSSAPVYKVGDKWTFIYGRTDSKQGTSVVQTVVVLTEKQTTFSSSRNDGPPHEVDFDNQGNLTRVAGTTYEPSLGSLSFPMMVGKSRDSHHVKRSTSGTLDISAHVEVVAFEHVQVAAGSFDAYKIVSHGVNSKNLDRLRHAPFTATPTGMRPV